MPNFANTIPSYSLEKGFSSPSRLFDRAALAFTKYRIYSRTLDELRALSDRDLADLGMHRTGLKAVAAEAARRKTA